MARQWLLSSQYGFETSLNYQEDLAIPSGDDLGPKDVLVKVQAASLNPREVMIASPNSLNGPIPGPVVPGCDGAGQVLAVGREVHDFKPGDRVVTHLAPKLVESDGGDAQAGLGDVLPMLGQGTHGTLRSHGVFSENALVHAPQTLEWLPAATLTCTWLTAWNCLFGLEGREAKPGVWVLVQGTGGVSVAALQLAVAAGAVVVATTSSNEKAARLKALGASHTINYSTNPDWGKEARGLTPNGAGFDIIIDIGGNQTLPQSLVAVRVNGQVLVVGGVGRDSEPVPLFSALMHTCIVRGLFAGSRNQLKEVVKFIDEKGIVPAVDDEVFNLTEAKDAYRRLQEKRHFSKVVIRVEHKED